MLMTSRYLAPVLSFALAVTTLMFAPAAVSATNVFEDGKRKINLAGRQRMLSQRMAKAVCFVSQGIHPEKFREQALAAHDQFAKGLAGLRNGDPDLDLPEETGPIILVALTQVDEIWETYSMLIRKAVSRESVDPVTLESISDISVPVLQQAHKAVGKFEQRYASTEIHPSLALAINMSGRQRMLTQRAAKEFCMIAAGIDVEGHRAALGETIALFNSSQDALTNGNYDIGLPEAPTDEVYDQLRLAESLWQPLNAIFAKVAEGAAPTQEDLEVVAQQIDDVLVEANNVVGLYEGL